MTTTRFIRYEIEPFGVPAFEDNARNRGQAIAGSGADLIGYFAPYEGSATTAYGVYNVESLAAYEAYRARLRGDPLGRENYAFAAKERFIRKESRLFLRLVSTPHAPLVRP
ncbi:MAG: NIPSNAP family protein [Rhodospirillales bacterium]|nr:NIPSNAP family protein [Rhodospirillales bacterium]